MSQILSADVIEWAKDFLGKAKAELSADERKEQLKFASLVRNPAGKTMLSKLLDESSQIKDDKKLSLRVKELIAEYGIPDYFSLPDKWAMKAFAGFGYNFPGIAMSVFRNKLRSETDKIIIAEERPALTNHLSKRYADKIGQNVNLLGEVVLGDTEAKHRYEHYLEALEEPDINYISVKLSGIYAQIKSLGYQQNKKELSELMANIYRRAMEYPYTDFDGKQKYKFVNLDMEEYKDAELTLDVFEDVLSRPEFLPYSAGIVVQAYLPDAELYYQRLATFAKERCGAGGVPLKIRLVKGANLQMESIVSSLKGWENPVLSTKIDVDANYLHILDLALKPENAKYLHVGVASHNFFSIGYAYLLSNKNGVNDYVTFEMLEGMANHLPRVMRKLEKQIILYTPVVKKENFLNAVSYLVRRLDENTGKDNFLRYSFNLELVSKEWDFLARQFITAYNKKDSMYGHSFRQQNRTLPVTSKEDYSVYQSEPDTDLDLEINRNWALRHLKKWETEINDTNFKIPVQIGDETVFTTDIKKYYDRSREDSVSFCEASLSSLEQVKQIVAIAEADDSQWRQTNLAHRTVILNKVADNIANQRGDLIGCMSAITGKTFTEGDVEVSEAIDFLRYYPYTLAQFEKLTSVKYNPKGIVLVIPPWNFPLAIPVGGVASALAGGNTVLLKPATVALPIAWKFAELFWEAGVPKDALQVVCPSQRDSLTYLTTHPSIKHIILTGGTDTAFRILESNPKTPLSAETGGKNAIILTAYGDQDHAIQNVITSAFGNAGQKCSACSLFLVEASVYDDPAFKTKLRDAVLSLRTGSVWDTINYVGPMITNDNHKLQHAIAHLEPGESWLVAPEFVDDKKYILKPTVKWGVREDSFTFKNELFAPLLSVVRINSLEHGIRLTNSTGYGLTSGLQSLDEKEIAVWKNTIEAGNLYINRGITGAIVNRQPFGGMKLSAFGGGIKAGGPNYVTCFLNFEENHLTEVGKVMHPVVELLDGANAKTRFSYALDNYKKAWVAEFSQERDVNNLYGESNVFRYLPVKKMALRVQSDDELTDLLLVLLASDTAKVNLVVSVDESYARLEVLKKAAVLFSAVSVIIESEEVFISSLSDYERIRTTSSTLSDELYREAAKLGKYIATASPLAEGRLELLHYLKEQSISHEYHRYGSIFGQ